jgi:hypothetical protein
VLEGCEYYNIPFALIYSHYGWREEKQKSRKHYYFLARSRDAWDEEKNILVGI